MQSRHCIMLIQVGTRVSARDGLCIHDTYRAQACASLDGS